VELKMIPILILTSLFIIALFALKPDGKENEELMFSSGTINTVKIVAKLLGF
jgi:hypothetical protein